MPEFNDLNLSKDVRRLNPDIRHGLGKVTNNASSTFYSPLIKPPNTHHARKSNKYHVAPKNDRTYNGKVYHSKKEAQRAQDNDLRIRAGDLDFYLEQVPITLPGGKKYLLDFLEFKKVASAIKGSPFYEVHFVEVKPDGKFRIETGEVKRSVAESVLGINIEEV